MIEVDIVSPTKKLVEKAPASSVKLPATKGEIEILLDHAELLTLLTTGTLSFHHQGNERRFAVSHGLAEVRNNKVMVLADTIEESTDIDKERARAAQKRAREKLTGVLEENEFKKHQLKLQRAIARQQT